MDVVRQRSGSQKELSGKNGFLFFLFTSKNSCCFFVIFHVFFLFSIMNLYHKSHRFDFFVSSVQTRHLQLQIGKKRVKSGKTVNYFLFCSCIELFFSKSSTSMKLDIYLIIHHHYPC